MWFRRDLRLGDHPALLAAADAAPATLALFVMDEHLLASSGAPLRRRSWTTWRNGPRRWPATSWSGRAAERLRRGVRRGAGPGRLPGP
ncbi:deoxyribodipyrimidine photo-lyase [Pseudonocardia sp.]|uniref:deoxyribodipyrimidine photo-lyase n=1 Tax=Pseudonocardia sp. TaxID=60912 RepID=UPI0039C9E4CF